MATKRKRTAEGSCWPCRKRRVLCDLTRPSCNRCLSRQQLCEYAQNRIRWVDGVASRGKLAGRSLPIPSSPPLSSLIPSVNDDQLLLYFERRVLPRFNLATEPLEFDLASIYHDGVLQRAATAVAKAHYAMDGKTRSGNDMASTEQTRLNALRTYREQLTKQVGSAASMESLFVTNILFCILDGIIEPSDESAAMYYHFNGGKAMLRNWVCLRKLDESSRGLESLVMSIYATMDLVYSLLSGSEPYFKKDWFLRRSDSDAWWGYLSAGDPFLELLAIFSELARMGHQANKLHGVVPITDLFQIQTELDTLATTINTLNQPETELEREKDERSCSWAAFCSAYRQTAFIYMYRALCNLEISHSLVQQSVCLGIDAICGKPLTGNLAHCLLFPSLIVGAHCTDPDQRERLRKSLLSTSSYLSFGSIQIMDAFLQQMWKSEPDDFIWWDTFRDLAMKTSLF